MPPSHYEHSRPRKHLASHPSHPPPKKKLPVPSHFMTTPAYTALFKKKIIISSARLAPKRVANSLDIEQFGRNEAWKRQHPHAEFGASTKEWPNLTVGSRTWRDSRVDTMRAALVCIFAGSRGTMAGFKTRAWRDSRVGTTFFFFFFFFLFFSFLLPFFIYFLFFWLYFYRANNNKRKGRRVVRQDWLRYAKVRLG